MNTIFRSWNGHEIFIFILVTVCFIWLLRSSTDILIATNLCEYTWKLLHRKLNHNFHSHLYIIKIDRRSMPVVLSQGALLKECILLFLQFTHLHDLILYLIFGQCIFPLSSVVIVNIFRGKNLSFISSYL